MKAARCGGRCSFSDVDTLLFGQLLVAVKGGRLAAVGVVPGARDDELLVEIVGRRDLAAERDREHRRLYNRWRRAARKAAGRPAPANPPRSVRRERAAARAART